MAWCDAERKFHKKKLQLFYYLNVNIPPFKNFEVVISRCSLTWEENAEEKIYILRDCLHLHAGSFSIKYFVLEVFVKPSTGKLTCNIIKLKVKIISAIKRSWSRPFQLIFSHTKLPLNGRKHDSCSLLR